MELKESPPPWLFSPSLDCVAFGLPVVLAMLLVALVPALNLASEDTPEWAWLGTVLLVDVAHVWGTLFRVYTDPTERRRRRWLYGGVPVVCWLAAAMLYQHDAALFWRALAYTAVGHFVRQQVGWVRLYGRKEGARAPWHGWLDHATLYGATLYPLIWWHTHLPRAFSWMMPGDFIALPQALEPIAQVFFASTLTLYTARALWLAGLGVRRLGKDMVVFGTVVCWYVGIVAFDSDYIFTVTNVLLHGIPYMVLIHVYRQSRQAPQRHTDQTHLYRGIIGLLMMLWGLAFAEEFMWDNTLWHERPWLFGGSWDFEAWDGWLVPMLAVPQLTHYVLDGFIWRRAQNPVLNRLFTSGGMPEKPSLPYPAHTLRAD